MNGRACLGCPPKRGGGNANPRPPPTPSPAPPSLHLERLSQAAMCISLNAQRVLVERLLRARHFPGADSALASRTERGPCCAPAVPAGRRAPCSPGSRAKVTVLKSLFSLRPHPRLHSGPWSLSSWMYLYFVHSTNAVESLQRALWVPAAGDTLKTSVLAGLHHWT